MFEYLHYEYEFRQRKFGTEYVKFLNFEFQILKYQVFTLV